MCTVHKWTWAAVVLRVRELPSPSVLVDEEVFSGTKTINLMTSTVWFQQRNQWRVGVGVLESTSCESQSSKGSIELMMLRITKNSNKWYWGQNGTVEENAEELWIWISEHGTECWITSMVKKSASNYWSIYVDFNQHVAFHSRNFFSASPKLVRQNYPLICDFDSWNIGQVVVARTRQSDVKLNVQIDSLFCLVLQQGVKQRTKIRLNQNSCREKKT